MDKHGHENRPGPRLGSRLSMGRGESTSSVPRIGAHYTPFVAKSLDRDISTDSWPVSDVQRAVSNLTGDLRTSFRELSIIAERFMPCEKFELFNDKVRQAYDKFNVNKRQVENEFDAHEARAKQLQAKADRLEKELREASSHGLNLFSVQPRHGGLRRLQGQEDLSVTKSKQSLEIERLKKASSEAQGNIRIQAEWLNSNRNSRFQMQPEEHSRARSTSTAHNSLESPTETPRSRARSSKVIAPSSVSTPSTRKKVFITSPTQSESSSQDEGGVSIYAGLSSHAIQALKGEPQAAIEDNSNALVIRSIGKSTLSNAEAAAQLGERGKIVAESFGNLFALHEGWVRKYASQPNVGSDAELHRRNPILWGYMQDLTIPGRRSESHTAVLAIIKDPSARRWFVMRMAITYCCKEVMVLKAWKGLGQHIDDGIDGIQKSLTSGERALPSLERHKIVERRAAIITSITTSVEYSEFKNKKIHEHINVLSTYMIAMISNDLTHEEKKRAGRDLAFLITKGWELSEMIWTFEATLVTAFPGLQNPFSVANMVAIECEEDSFQLQKDQVKLRLVVTPSVTLRSDFNGVIQTKGLQPARVLTMPNPRKDMGVKRDSHYR